MTNTGKSWKDIKPILSEFSSTQLLGLVQDLYRFSDQNASFIHARFLSNGIGQDHLIPYKTRIRKAICPKEPWKKGVHLVEGRKAINEFKKANGDIRDTLTLMVYYVKCGNDFTLEFGDIDEGFYGSLCSMMSAISQVLLTQSDQKLADEFLPVLEAEFRRVDGKMGWGYPDELSDYISDLRDAFA